MKEILIEIDRLAADEMERASKIHPMFASNHEGYAVIYEVGGRYAEAKADICNRGFHACEAPLGVLEYYPPATSRYCEVDLDANSQIGGSGSKRVGKRIKIGAEIGIAGLVKAHFEYVNSHVIELIKKGNSEAATAGYLGAAIAGDSGAATAGRSGAATAGDCGAATAGYSGAATAGYSGAATAGRSGVATAGDGGAATAGYSGAATAGDSGAATAGRSGAATAGRSGAATAGDCGAATAGRSGVATSRGESATGENGLSVARGNGVRVKGGIGSVLVIAEEKIDSFKVANWKAAIVDGDEIKADTWYRLVGDELVEVSEDE